MLQIFKKVKPKTWKKTKRKADYQAKKALGKLRTYATMTDEQKKARSKRHHEYRVRKLREKHPSYVESHRKYVRKWMLQNNQRKRGEVKECSMCHRTLPYCKFDLRHPAKGKTKHQWYSHYIKPPKETLRPYCKECRSKYNKEYYARRKQLQGR